MFPGAWLMAERCWPVAGSQILTRRVGRARVDYATVSGYRL
jgi:hypothetical protein